MRDDIIRPWRFNYRLTIFPWYFMVFVGLECCDGQNKSNSGQMTYFWIKSTAFGLATNIYLVNKDSERRPGVFKFLL